jgi:hypothetical protein
MTIKIINAVKNHKDLQHQIDAWEFLQASVSEEVLKENYFRKEMDYKEP